MYNNMYYPGAGSGFVPVEEMRRSEKRDIRFFSAVAGLGVIAYVIIQNLVGIVLALFPPLVQVYNQSEVFRCIFGVLCSVAGVLLPFSICAAIIKEVKKTDVAELGAPKSAPVMLMLLAPAFLACLGANYLTGMFTVVAENNGFRLLGGEFDSPESLMGKLFYVLEIAVIPPLCEEFAVRGVIMQPLRRYGDWFAIAASSFVFAIMHGNLVQAPFAFIVGIVIGYAVCVTGTVWTGVLIHFLNNGFSVLLDVTDGSSAQIIIYNAALYFALITGVISLVLLVKNHRSQLKLGANRTTLTGGEKGRAFIFSLPMLAALAVMVYITSQFVERTGG